MRQGMNGVTEQWSINMILSAATAATPRLVVRIRERVARFQVISRLANFDLGRFLVRCLILRRILVVVARSVVESLQKMRVRKCMQRRNKAIKRAKSDLRNISSECSMQAP